MLLEKYNAARTAIMHNYKGMPPDYELQNLMSIFSQTFVPESESDPKCKCGITTIREHTGHVNPTQQHVTRRTLEWVLEGRLLNRDESLQQVLQHIRTLCAFKNVGVDKSDFGIIAAAAIPGIGKTTFGRWLCTDPEGKITQALRQQGYPRADIVPLFVTYNEWMKLSASFVHKKREGM